MSAWWLVDSTRTHICTTLFYFSFFFSFVRSFHGSAFAFLCYTKASPLFVMVLVLKSMRALCSWVCIGQMRLRAPERDEYRGPFVSDPFSHHVHCVVRIHTHTHTHMCWHIIRLLRMNILSDFLVSFLSLSPSFECPVCTNPAANKCGNLNAKWIPWKTLTNKMLSSVSSSAGHTENWKQLNGKNKSIKQRAEADLPNIHLFSLRSGTDGSDVFVHCDGVSRRWRMVFVSNILKVPQLICKNTIFVHAISLH